MYVPLFFIEGQYELEHLVSPFCGAFSFEGTSVFFFDDYDKLQTELDFGECVEIVIHSRWYFEVHVLSENVYSVSEVEKKI